MIPAPGYRYRGGLLFVSCIAVVSMSFSTSLITVPEGESMASAGEVSDTASTDVTRDDTMPVDVTTILSARERHFEDLTVNEREAPPVSMNMDTQAVQAPDMTITPISPDLPEPDPEGEDAEGAVIEDGTEIGGVDIHGWTADAVRALLSQGLLAYEARSDRGDFIVMPDGMSFSVQPAQSVAGLSQIEVRRDVHLVHGHAQIETALRLGDHASIVRSVALVFTNEAVAPLSGDLSEGQALALCIVTEAGTASVTGCPERRD